MLHNIIPQGTIGAGASSSGSLAQQDINGIIVSVSGAAFPTWHANDYVTVTLKSPMHSQEVLVNRVPALALAHVSDCEEGYSYGLAKILSEMDVEMGTDAALDSIGQANTIAFAVPLGCLKNVATDSEIEVLFESGASKVVSVAGYFHKDGPDHAIKTLETTVLRDSAAGCKSIYAFRNADLKDWTSVAASFLLKTPQGSTICNQLDAAGYTAVFGKHEANVPQRVVKIWEGSDDVDDVVYWQITGTDSTNYTIITRSVERFVPRVSAGTMYAANKLVARLDGRPADQQRALRRSGIAPKQSVLRDWVSRANLGDYKPVRLA